MPEGRTLEGDERLRLFTALRLPEPAAETLARWQRRELADVRNVRPIPRENLHVTLAFLGSTPAGAVTGIVAALREAAADLPRPVLRVAGYRETRSVGMVVFDDEDGRAGLLAERLFERLERLGVYERERRRWTAHVTVLRFREQPRLRPALPDLGPISPSEVALYDSVLRPTGAQYEVRESVALGG